MATSAPEFKAFAHQSGRAPFTGPGAQGLMACAAIIVGAGVALGQVSVIFAFEVILGLVVARLYVNRSRMISGISLVLFSSLVILTYGANNIPAVPGLPMPLVSFASAGLALIIVAYRPKTLRLSPLPSIAGLIAAWTAVRLLLDVPSYGSAAFRDALFVVDMSGLVIGLHLTRALSTATLVAWLRGTLLVASFWYCLTPFAGIIAALGPQVGLQRDVALLSFAGAVFIPVLAVLWFRLDSHWSRAVGLPLSLVSVLVAQSRFGYALTVAILLSPLRRLSTRSDGAPSVSGPSVANYLIAGGALVVMVLAPLRLPGRLDTVSVESSSDVVLSLVSPRESELGGGVTNRLEWWSESLSSTPRNLSTIAIGSGFGPALVTFSDLAGVSVRKPHNDYLEMYLRGGAILLCLWVWLLYTVVAGAWSTYRSHMHMLNLWLFGSLCLLALVSSFQPLFAFSYGGLVFFILAGLGAATANPSAGRGQR